MFIGVYLAVCGIQYLIIIAVCLILVWRKAASSELTKMLVQYSLLALSASLLGLVLFSLVTIPVGNLHFNIPEDFTNLTSLLASLPKIFALLLGLLGATAPLWVLAFIIPRAAPSDRAE